MRTEPYVSCRCVNNLELVNGFSPVDRFPFVDHGTEVREVDTGERNVDILEHNTFKE